MSPAAVAIFAALLIRRLYPHTPRVLVRRDTLRLWEEQRREAAEKRESACGEATMITNDLEIIATELQLSGDVTT